MKKENDSVRFAIAQLALGFRPSRLTINVKWKQNKQQKLHNQK